MRTRLFEDPKTRRLFAGAGLLAVLSVALAPLHTGSALLSLPFTGSLAFLVCDVLSHCITGREFIFPSKWGLNTSEELQLMAWTDRILGVLCGVLAVLGLFVFGELVDCLRGENVWRGEAVGLSWCGESAG